MTRSRYLLQTILLLLAVLLAMANGLVYYERIDLTEGRLHTISEATHDILGAIDSPVAVTYYLSDSLLQRYPEPRDVLDLLSEYEAASRGSVNVRVVDPSDRSTPEEIAGLGVVPQQLDVTEGSERRTAIVYSGIVLEYLDRSDSLPFVFSSETLEYELTTTVRDLVLDDRRTLGFILGDPGETLERDYRLISNELARRYELRTVAVGEPIPDDIDVVVVLDAGLLDGGQMSAVSAYLDRGGAALFAYDAVRVDIAAGLEAEPVPARAAKELLARYGVLPGEELVLDELHNEILVEEESASFRVQRSYPYPPWPATVERYTSSSHPVTARFAGLDLYWPTRLELDAGYDGASIIVATSPRAWLMDAPFNLSPEDPSRLTAPSDELPAQYGVVAVSRSSDPMRGRVGVVADADFLRDRLIQATGSAQNLEFALNLSEWLSNDEALLGIRTRPSRSFGLDAIDEPRLATTLQFFATALNLVLVPGAVILYGAIRLRRRRRIARPALRSDASGRME